MASSLTITSANPNNNPILVMVQNFDEQGGALGEPETVGLLDDGESMTLMVHKRRVAMLGEANRGDRHQMGVPPSAAEMKAPDAPVAAVEQPIPVIGHETQDAPPAAQPAAPAELEPAV